MGDYITLICLYVYDMLVIRNNINNLKKFKQLTMKELEMSYLGNLSYVSCMEFLKNYKGIILHQRKYVR